MFDILKNMRITHKLMLNNAIFFLCIILCCVVGYRAMEDGNKAMQEMYYEHFVAATHGGALKSDLNEVRALLVAMMSQSDLEKQQKLHEGIKKLSSKIDQNIASLLTGKFPKEMIEEIKKIKEPWELFRDTRDKELIPAIYDGDMAKARGLALGVQAGRYRKFVDLTDEFINTELGEGEENFQAYEAEAKRSELILLLLVMAVVGLGLLLTRIITNLINNPLGKVIEIAEQVASGNLTVEKSDYVSRDGIGKLTGSVNRMLGNLTEIIRTIQESTGRIASASTELSATSEEMSATADTQVSHSGTLSASSDEMANAIIDVAKNSNMAAESSRSATEKAYAGKEVIGQSQGIISTLAQNSEKVGNVVNLIADIANKTDLLAINAAIEAANAGEQGKGFAVVADEVRKLAERTTKATREITNVIAAIGENTKEAIGSMDQAGSTMESISEGVETTTKMIEQIAAATEEQSTTIEVFAETIQVITDSSRDVNGGTTETAKAAEELSSLSSELKQVVDKFKLKGQ